jgi:hypothetical protein
MMLLRRMGKPQGDPACCDTNKCDHGLYDLDDMRLLGCMKAGTFRYARKQ